MALTPQGEALLTQLNADLEAWDIPIETRLAQLAVLPASDREQIPTILSRGVDALRAQADAATDRIQAALSAGGIVTFETRQASAEYNDRLRQLAAQLEQLADRVTHLDTPVAAVTEQSPTPAQQLRPVSIRRAVPSQVPAPQVSTTGPSLRAVRIRPTTTPEVHTAGVEQENAPAPDGLPAFSPRFRRPQPPGTIGIG